MASNSALNGDVERLYSHRVRNLTEQQVNTLEIDSKTVSDYKRNKLETDARKNWDLFYKRNTTKFFKDRHWTKREFEELCGSQNEVEKLVVLEVGCGVGNFIFPLIKEDTNKQFFFYACDFSTRAVQFVKENEQYDTSHCHAFQCDVTQDNLLDVIAENSVDIATLIFVLSAISPEKMILVLENICKVLKPGGLLLFRDYGLYDHAMLRFAPGHKISRNFYVRQDGTRAYYFSEEEVDELFSSCGYELVCNEYVKRQTVNKKEGLSVERIFVQSKFRKRPSTLSSVKTSNSSVSDSTHALDVHRCEDNPGHNPDNNDLENINICDNVQNTDICS